MLDIVHFSQPLASSDSDGDLGHCCTCRIIQALGYFTPAGKEVEKKKDDHADSFQAMALWTTSLPLQDR